MIKKLAIRSAAELLRQYLNKKTAVIISLSIIGIGLSILHYLAAENMSGVWYVVHLSLRRLYFLPVLVAALLAGKRGAFIVAVVVTITYLPHMLFHWSGTLAAQSENVSDLGLLWIVGLLAGYLSDRLKRSHEEKACLVAIENLSGVFGLVLQQMQVDFEAGLGLSRALGQQIDGGGDSRFTAKILEQRLDRLGFHLASLRRIIGANKVVKKRKNLVKIIRKGIDSLNSSGASIRLHMQGRIPHFFLDEEKIDFALRQFFQTMRIENEGADRIDAKVAKVGNSAKINIKSSTVSEYARAVSENDENYALSLALAIIKTHGGSAEMVKPDGRLLAVNISLPLG